MAVDAFGLPITTGKTYIAVGTARVVDGDTVVLVAGNKGENVLRVNAADVLNFADLVLVLAAIYQPLHARLTAISGLSPSADQVPYYTGATTMALASLSSWVRANLLSVADAAAARTALGVDPDTSKWKQSVRVATTTNGTLATAFANGQTVDGVTLATGDRILLKAQSAAADNGIYTVNASGAPTRATDGNTGTKLVSAHVPVEQGSANADTVWVCTTNSITLGTTAQTWSSMVTTIKAAPLVHSHVGTDVTLDDSAWGGSLAGSGIRDVQALADYIDANFTP
ncbi:MAG: hypothetical protein JNK15_03175 [Planctomycetes bacterium]|nr:hypothetical protein [Planctomycetota bacterium]